MTSISKKDLEDLKATELEILKEVTAFCDKNNLTYFLVGGTLLGSVRHQGFIPWDDDIDIGMLREDYEKFIKLYPKDKNGKYYIQCLENDSNYWLPFAKIRKSNTLMLEADLEGTNLNKEIFIDVFPFDTVPDTGYKKFKWVAFLIINNVEAILAKRLKKKAPRIYSKVLKIFPVKFLYYFEKKLMMKYDKKDYNHLICYCGRYAKEKEYLERDVILPVKKGDFEGLKFNIMNKPDVYLTNLYGDYMKLPPKEKQETHGILKVNVHKGEHHE